MYIVIWPYIQPVYTTGDDLSGTTAHSFKENVSSLNATKYDSHFA
jgi:hypothetical protein